MAPPRPKQRAAILAACFGFVLLATLLLLTRRAAKPDPDSALRTLDSAVRFDPRVARRNRSDLIWQLPASPPRAAVFVAPGCTIRAADFWDASPGRCPRCRGLPEERRFVLDALRRGFAVLAVSSWGECWTFHEEMDAVESAIRWWLAEHRLGGLPLVAIGASSGGYFVSALATRVAFSSIAVMIAEGVYATMEVPEGYPPTLFVHMPKDSVRKREVEVNMEALRAKGVDVQEVRCMHFPVSPDFLAGRIPGLSRDFAVELIGVLCRKGFVDGKGYLRRDGRAIPWEKALEERKLLPENFRWARHVTEELNLAYAYHEFTSLKNDEIFGWFESHMKKKS